MRVFVLALCGLVTQDTMAQDSAGALEQAFAACSDITKSQQGVSCSLSQRETGLFDLVLAASSHDDLGSFVVKGADIAKTVCLQNEVFYTNSVVDEKGYIRSMVFKCSPSDHKLTKYRGWHVNGAPIAGTQTSGR